MSGSGQAGITRYRRAGAALAAVLVTAALLPLVAAGPVQAATTTLVSNIDQTPGVVSGNLAAHDFAAGFTTGSNVTGYSLRDIEIRFGADSTPSGLSVRLATGPATNPTDVATLTNPATLVRGINRFAAPANTMLSANTTYFVVVEGTAGHVRRTTSDAEDSGGASGWSVADTTRFRTASSTGNFVSRSDSLLIRVNGSANPLPELMSAEVDGTKLEMEFNQSLNTAVVPAPGDFAVTVEGTARSVASGSVAVAGKKVTLTLSSAVTVGQTVTVSYTKPTGATAMPLENTANVDVETFGAQPVTNVTAPVISGIEIVSKPRNSETVGTDLLPTYGRNQPIVVAVTWNGPVTWDLSSTGAGMRVRLQVGSTNRSAELVTDGATSGTASTLWFSYTAVQGDTDTDGVAVVPPTSGGNKDKVLFLRNGATLKGAAGTDAAKKNAGVDFAAGLSAQSGHRVKGTIAAAGNSAPLYDDDDDPMTPGVASAVLDSINATPATLTHHSNVGTDISDADNDNLRFTVTAARPDTLDTHRFNSGTWWFRAHHACVLEDIEPALTRNAANEFENAVTLTATDPDGDSVTLTSTLLIEWECGKFIRASVNGTALTLTYDVIVSTSLTGTDAADQFEITVDGAPAELAATNPVTRSGSTLTANLATAVTRNQEVSVTFRPAVATHRGVVDQPVVNERNTVPSSAAVSGNTLTVTFNRNVSIESGGTAADLAKAFSATGMHWSVDEDGDNTPDGSIPLRRVAPESASVSGAVVTLTFGSNIVPSKQVTVDYYSGIAQTAGAGLLDADSIRVPSVSGQAVTATVPATAPPRLVSGQVAGTELTLTFDGDLDSSSAPPGSRFRVEVDPVDFFEPVRPIRGTGTATVDGKTATVTLASAVAEGERAAVWYEPLSTDTSPLRGASTGPKVTDIWDTVISVADRTAPTVVDSVLEGTTLVLYYSEKLDTSSVPSLSGGLSALAFLLAPHGTTSFFVASDIAVHDDAVTLTLPTRTESAFSLDYTVLTENAIQDVAGNKAAAFAQRRLDRSITSDPGAPSLAATSPAVADQGVLRLTFNRSLDPSSVPSANAFTIGDSVRGTNHGLAITDVAIRGAKVELSISPGFLPCRGGISVSYTAPDDDALANLWGTDAASFSDQAVTNQQSSRCVRTPVSAAPMGNSGLQGNSDPVGARGTDRLGLSFDRSMHQRVPDPQGFTVRTRTPRGAPAAPVQVRSVEFSAAATQLQVALSRTLDPGEQVTVSYQHPRSGSGLWDSDGNQIAPFSASTVVPAAAPTVTGVEVVSDAGDDSTYAMGQVISLRVTFSEAVDVTGTPTLGIDMDPAHWGRKDAVYASGSGTAELTFTHEVTWPNFSSQGIAVLADTLATKGGTIQSTAGGVDADLAHSGLDHDPAHKVDWRRTKPVAEITMQMNCGPTQGGAHQRWQVPEPAADFAGNPMIADRMIAGQCTMISPPDASVSWSLSGADAARFEISDDGTLSFVGLAPDFEAPSDSDGDNVYDVTITAAVGDQTLPYSVAVAVTDVYEASPTVVEPTEPDPTTVAEPVLATVNGNELTLIFTKEFAAIDDATARTLRQYFVVDGGRDAHGTEVDGQSPSAVAVKSNLLTLTLVAAVTPGDEVTVSYYGGLTDSDGTAVAAFSTTFTTTFMTFDLP